MLKKIIFLAADGLSVFLDLMVGALIGFLVGRAFGQDVPWWNLFPAAIFGILPDFDLLIEIGVRGGIKGGDHHRTILHKPLVMVPLIAGTCGLVFGISWAIIAAVCLLWHYLHDRFSGIKCLNWTWATSEINWLWPFVQKDIKTVIDLPEWRKYWLAPSKLSVTEITLSTGILFFLVSHYAGTNIATAATIIFLLCVCSLWFMWWVCRDF